jgi:hypothetical protein
LNSLSGSLSITAGSGISVTPSGSNIAIAVTSAPPTEIWYTDDFLYPFPSLGIGSGCTSSTYGQNFWEVCSADGNAQSGTPSTEPSVNGYLDVASNFNTNSWATLFPFYSGSSFPPPVYVTSGGAGTVAWKVKNATTGAGLKYWVGLQNPNNGTNGFSNPVTSTDAILFGADNTDFGNDDWWTLIVTGGTFGTPVDTGVPSGAWHTLEVSMSGTTATFYIDGASYGSATAASAGYFPTVTAWHVSGTPTPNLYVDWFGVQSSATLH